MINENESSDEKSYYSDYDEETDQELEKELPDATGKKKYLNYPGKILVDATRHSRNPRPRKSLIKAVLIEHLTLEFRRLGRRR